MKIEFFISLPGGPRPQKRHRDSRNGGKYDPSVADKRELQYLMARHKPTDPWVEPVSVSMRFYFPIPKSYRDKTVEIHAKKPDIDNLFKLVSDSMNGTFYKDDGQIHKCELVKYYTRQEPGLWVRIEKVKFL